MRMLLGLVTFPILGNLLRLGSERVVKAMDVRGRVVCLCATLTLPSQPCLETPIRIQSSPPKYKVHTWAQTSKPTNERMPQEHGAHLASSTYPSVLANIGGCFLMGVMYEARVRFALGLLLDMKPYRVRK